ncbi:hypothetical protein GCM10008905_21880 [Clostridium malenominatum]|uniref:CRISPR associated protein Cas6 C-terminal domain-containing protein n=1 Tax=Clostridium malenominatum TaxID=1539 RepID=A0ABN1J1I2_9CLOT
MKVTELILKVYLIKDISYQDSLSSIAKIVDKSLLREEAYANFHEKNTYKNYVYTSLYPLEKTKIYRAGKIYTIQLRTVDENLANYFQRNLVNEYSDEIKVLTIDKKIIPQRYIEKIYSITPAVAKFPNGYWRKNETLESYEKRLKENLIKKYNKFFNETINEEFEFITFLNFENMKPISMNYKNIRMLGDKLTVNIAENSMAQELAHFALGAGILEMNSRGYGFVNYKWL